MAEQLPAGFKLGHYEILDLIGAGGMGQVYRALDTRLGRTVAVKVLHPHLVARGDFLQRFELEARATAALKHPNICTLYDVGSQDGIHYLVMEYIEGKPPKGPMAPEQLMKCGAEVGSGLDHAHRRGFIHRDLKPGNILMAQTGAKLLDFGLAKALPSVEPLPDGTLTEGLTKEGTIMGTFAYMSPEQVEGRPSGVPGDVWAWGAVMYELATGKRAFTGETQAALGAAILRSEPEPAAIPPPLDRILRRCFAKDPEDRWQSARDIVLELRETPAAPAVEPVSLPPTPPPTPPPPPAADSRSRIAMIALALALAVVSALYLRREPPPSRPLLTFEVPPPEGTRLSGNALLKISPDGTKIAFGAQTIQGAGTASLWIHALDSGKSYAVPETERATNALWSPDSKSLAFLQQGKVRRIDVGGGSPVTVCECNFRPAAWSRDNHIYLTSQPAGPVTRVAATGGSPAPFTRLDASKGETGHASIQLAGDGSHYLYRSYASPEHTGIYAVRVKDGEVKKVELPGARGEGRDGAPVVRYIHGLILFQRGDGVYGQRFNPDKLELEGEAFPIVESATITMVSASDDGTLAYPRNDSSDRAGDLLLADAKGTRLATLKAAEGAYLHFEVSPDGKRLAVDRQLRPGTPRDLDGVWTIDIARNVAAPLVPDQGSGVPAWSADGASVFFTAGNRVGRIPAHGSGKAEFVDVESPHHMHASPDGKWLAYERSPTRGVSSIWYMPTDGSGKPAPLSQNRATEWFPRFSPDSRWIAYASDESGRPEVYIQSFPPGKGKWLASRASGGQPLWRGDGRELYFAEPRWLTAVEVKGRGD